MDFVSFVWSTYQTRTTWLCPITSSSSGLFSAWRHRRRMIEYQVIRPQADAEFFAHMEEVLETYEKLAILHTQFFAWTNNLLND